MSAFPAELLAAMLLATWALPAQAAPPRWETLRPAVGAPAGPCTARDGVLAYRAGVRADGDVQVHMVERLDVKTGEATPAGAARLNAPLFVTRDGIIMQSPRGIDRQGIKDRTTRLLERPGLREIAVYGDGEVYQLVNVSAADGGGVELQMDHLGAPPGTAGFRPRVQVEHVAPGVPRALFTGSAGDGRLAVLVDQPRRQLDIYPLDEVRRVVLPRPGVLDVQHVLLPDLSRTNPDLSVSVVLRDTELFMLVDGRRGHELHHLAPPFHATTMLHGDGRTWFRGSELQVDETHIYYVVLRQAGGVDVVRVPRPRGDHKKPPPEPLLSDDAGVSITLDSGWLYACSTVTGSIRRLKVR